MEKVETIQRISMLQVSIHKFKLEDTSVEFIHQQMHFYSFKEHIKIYIKIHINIAPTCFGLRSSSGSLH